MNSAKYFFLLLLFAMPWITGCNDDDVPAAENEEEVINEITLTFTPAAGGASSTFSYLDPDGEGTAAPNQDAIVLQPGKVYTLQLTLKNTLGEQEEVISDEVAAEGDEHQFFFEWTGSLFSSPKGLGNIGSGSQHNELNYQDKDVNGLPIGLQTIWETAAAPASGTFRLLLKHQPFIKSENSTSEEGESDLDITWDISVQ